MNWLKIIMSLGGFISNLGNKVTNVIFDERKSRARRDLEELKRRKENLMSAPPNKRRAKRLWAVEKRIKEIQSYLSNQ